MSYNKLMYFIKKNRWNRHFLSYIYIPRLSFGDIFNILTDIFWGIYFWIKQLWYYSFVYFVYIKKSHVIKYKCEVYFLCRGISGQNYWDISHFLKYLFQNIFLDETTMILFIRLLCLYQIIICNNIKMRFILFIQRYSGT